MLNIINNTFGYLEVIEVDQNQNNNRKKYICKCKCGNYTSVTAYALTSGRTTSCGCKKHESKNCTHGKRNTRLYSIWCDMKKRCYNPNSKSYKTYGARGIILCDEWVNDFQSFYNWAINNGYSDNLSIERINNNDNYTPNNCRWITHEEQQQNKSNTIKITHNGETYSLSKWCKKLDVNFKTTYYKYTQLKNNNIEPSFKLLFESPITSPNSPKRIYQYDKNGNLIKSYESINSVSKEGFSRSAVSQCCSGKIKSSGGFIWKAH